MENEKSSLIIKAFNTARIPTRYRDLSIGDFVSSVSHEHFRKLVKYFTNYRRALEMGYGCVLCGPGPGKTSIACIGLCHILRKEHAGVLFIEAEKFLEAQKPERVWEVPFLYVDNVKLRELYSPKELRRLDALIIFRRNRSKPTILSTSVNWTDTGLPLEYGFFKVLFDNDDLRNRVRENDRDRFFGS